MPRSSWAVMVDRDGENIVTIGSNHLSGKGDMTEQDQQAIRDAAQHLLSFVGTGEPSCTCWLGDTENSECCDVHRRSGEASSSGDSHEMTNQATPDPPHVRVEASSEQDDPAEELLRALDTMYRYSSDEGCPLFESHRFVRPNRAIDVVRVWLEDMAQARAEAPSAASVVADDLPGNASSSSDPLREALIALVEEIRQEADWAYRSNEGAESAYLKCLDKLLALLEIPPGGER